MWSPYCKFTFYEKNLLKKSCFIFLRSITGRLTHRYFRYQVVFKGITCKMSLAPILTAVICIFVLPDFLVFLLPCFHSKVRKYLQFCVLPCFILLYLLKLWSLTVYVFYFAVTFSIWEVFLS